MGFLLELGVRAATATLDPIGKLAFSFNNCLSLYKDLMLFVSLTPLA